MKRLFVLNGGAAVKPGNKSAFLKIDDPLSTFSRGGINTGDVLVYDAMLKALAYDQITNVQFAHAEDEKLWPKQEYDAAVIRGSNYLTETVDIGNVIPLLKKLKGPIVPIGVGAQAAKYKKLELPKGSVEAWKIIADKCETIGVRGVYSAEVFNDLGIKNIRIIGCPSFYRDLRPSIQIKPLDPANARVGLTLNRYLSADYASNATKTNRMQRALIQAVARRAQNRLYSQGEREETLAIFDKGESKQKHIQSILGKYGLTGDKDVETLMGERMQAFFDVDEWAADAKENVDVLVGFRLHGNVIGLHQGIPAVFFTYDSRIRELSTLFAIPSVEVEEYLPINLEKIFETADFSKVQHVYRLNYAEYHRFLTENGLNHVLPKPVASPPEKPLVKPNLVQTGQNLDEVTGWFQDEVDFMTGEIETLRSRAWNLELKLRELKGADPKAKLAS
ncbi:MAG: polysaccharide pyruvyl transferase family protein [Roseibium sp.]|uniref:polysaccharide pyruvyl transferase family protein n=1 Tax=Roseibium sp. TaxID=1936156 RepID=UPI0026045130|nr:polysaccharide pyruvyl transferase family protein [Roseibium sp.]MCV0425188.1 polysaccharide pyruvyl transferase family protein [Roseibium sp.]